MGHKKRDGGKMFFAAFSLSLIVLATAMVGTVLAVQPAMPDREGEAEESGYVYRPPASDTLTMVVIGVESSGKAREFLLMRFNPQYGQIPVTLLPPQTKVRDAEESTLAQIYEKNGPETLKKLLGEYLGIEVERYTVLSGSPFLRAAAKAGTVSYTLPYEIAYQKGETSIHFAAGEQHLDGQDILDLFATPAFRETPIEKSELLGNLVAEAVNQNISAASEERASGIFKLVINLIRTDISSTDFEMRRESAAYLAGRGNRQIAGNLPIEGEWSDQIFIPSEAYRDLVRQYFQPAY